MDLKHNAPYGTFQNWIESISVAGPLIVPSNRLAPDSRRSIQTDSPGFTSGHLNLTVACYFVGWTSVTFPYAARKGDTSRSLSPAYSAGRIFLSLE